MGVAALAQTAIFNPNEQKTLCQCGNPTHIEKLSRSKCEQLPAKKYLEVVKTNREFAKKYAISPRTVTTWRKEGCPFEDGQWAVLDWLAERRYAPAGAKSEVWEAT